MNTKQTAQGFALFLAGYGAGAGTAVALREEPQPLPEVDCADPLPTDPTKPPSYCATFPERCNNPEPCPPVVVDETGQQTGGCTPVEWVCCSPGLGCWAVYSATDCGDASLYWSDCEAGESAIDPDTGESIIICHD
jgi:hypothetical protein